MQECKAQWLQNSRFPPALSSTKYLLLGPGQPAKEEQDRQAREHRFGCTRYYWLGHRVRQGSCGRGRGSGRGQSSRAFDFLIPFS